MNDVTTTMTQAKPQLVVMRERFEARKLELAKALPSDVSPDVFIRAVMTSMTLNPELQACTFPSLWNACLRACRDGLLPDGVEGAIVPHKTSATWIPMYVGLLRRFRRSGQFKWLTAGIVRKGETFEHWITAEEGEHFRHVPGDDIKQPILRIYCIAKTMDGGTFVAVMPIAEADKIRAMSRTTREDAPWKQWPEEMYKKTAIRRLSKYLPSARDIVGEEDLPEVPDISAPLPASALPVGVVPEGGEPGTEEVTTPSESPAADPVDPITLAYQEGVDARAKGIARRAIPGPYREQARVRLQIAWLAGWDGKDMPSFTEEEKHD
jgi:phage RecT family recombinase